MTNKTSKQSDNLDFEQVIAEVYNGVDKSITTASFVVGKVGHKIEKVNVSVNIEDYKYYDGSTLLYTIRITYTDGTKTDLSSVERTV